jgi:hypothetical protein
MPTRVQEFIAAIERRDEDELFDKFRADGPRIPVDDEGNLKPMNLSIPFVFDRTDIPELVELGHRQPFRVFLGEEESCTEIDMAILEALPYITIRGHFGVFMEILHILRTSVSPKCESIFCCFPSIENARLTPDQIELCVELWRIAVTHMIELDLALPSGSECIYNPTNRIDDNREPCDNIYAMNPNGWMDIKQLAGRIPFASRLSLSFHPFLPLRLGEHIQSSWEEVLQPWLTRLHEERYLVIKYMNMNRCRQCFEIAFDVRSRYGVHTEMTLPIENATDEEFKVAGRLYNLALVGRTAKAREKNQTPLSTDLIRLVAMCLYGHGT